MRSVWCFGESLQTLQRARASRDDSDPFPYNSKKRTSEQHYREPDCWIRLRKVLSSMSSRDTQFALLWVMAKRVDASMVLKQPHQQHATYSRSHQYSDIGKLPRFTNPLHHLLIISFQHQGQWQQNWEIWGEEWGLWTTVYWSMEYYYRVLAIIVLEEKNNVCTALTCEWCTVCILYAYMYDAYMCMIRAYTLHAHGILQRYQYSECNCKMLQVAQLPNARPYTIHTTHW